MQPKYATIYMSDLKEGRGEGKWYIIISKSKIVKEIETKMSYLKPSVRLVIFS